MRLRPSFTEEQARQVEEGEVTTVGILLIIWTSLKKLTDKAAIILWSSFILLMLWGFHGDMAILTSLFGEGWTDRITFGLGWGQQLVSFLIGFLLVVVVPCLIIKFRFKESLRDYGLGWPVKDQRKKATVAFFSMLVAAGVLVVVASFDKGMQQEYPLFAQRGGAIEHWWEFIVYELVYVLFFITIEFAFRGYLLFGLHSIRFGKGRGAGGSSVLRFGIYSILIQMLAYTTWHYGKPVPEMVGTVIWGVSVAAIALRIRSIWPIIAAHWLYNVLLDVLTWKVVGR